MPQTVEVRFKGTRRDFFLWSDEREPLRLQEAVVVELDRGHDLGRVQTTGEVAEKKCGGGCTSCAVGQGIEEGRNGGQAVETVETVETVEGDEVLRAQEASPEDGLTVPTVPIAPAPSAPAGPALRSILRRATQEDIRIANELRRSEEDARKQVLEKVRQHRLDMKVSDAEWQWDRAKLSIYFTAEKRVDFRALVRDLASLFRTRIELRQIGVRDEAARLTGVGRCGREYCCSSWLKDLSPVSLALAKDQHLSLNPAQISGGCGRLLCCLKYEHEFYVAARRRFPREGKTLETAVGREKVVAVDIFRERVFLRSEEHGSRIIPLVQFKEETENLQSSTASAPPGAPAARAGGSLSPQPPTAPDRRGTRADRRQRQDRPAATPARPGPAPPPMTEAPPPTAGPDQAQRETPSSDAPKRSRRRRRGRRGRGGPGATGAPGSPPAPEA